MEMSGEDKMLKAAREEKKSPLEIAEYYTEKFFKEFGNQFKYGIYSSFGMNKEILQDLLLFYSGQLKFFFSVSLSILLSQKF